MNVLPVKAPRIPRDPPQFQVDTGPLIVPDFDSTADRQIERFDMGYVVYQEFDQAEFILRRPVAGPVARAAGDGDYGLLGCADSPGPQHHSRAASAGVRG